MLQEFWQGKSVHEPVQTGIKAIFDSLLPIGSRAAGINYFGDRQTGKTALVIDYYFKSTYTK